MPPPQVRVPEEGNPDSGVGAAWHPGSSSKHLNFLFDATELARDCDCLTVDTVDTS